MQGAKARIALHVRETDVALCVSPVQPLERRIRVAAHGLDLRDLESPSLGMFVHQSPQRCLGARLVAECAVYDRE